MSRKWLRRIFVLCANQTRAFVVTDLIADREAIINDWFCSPRPEALVDCGSSKNRQAAAEK